MRLIKDQLLQELKMTIHSFISIRKSYIVGYFKLNINEAQTEPKDAYLRLNVSTFYHMPRWGGQTIMSLPHESARIK